jgi:hypothetical protein
LLPVFLLFEQCHPAEQALIFYAAPIPQVKKGELKKGKTVWKKGKKNWGERGSNCPQVKKG